MRTREANLSAAVRWLNLTYAVREVQGPRYQAAAQAVKGFSTALEQDAARRKFVSQLRRHLSLI